MNEISPVETVNILTLLVQAGPAGVMAVALLLFGWLFSRAEDRRAERRDLTFADIMRAERENFAKLVEAEREGHDREVALILSKYDSMIVALSDHKSEIIDELSELRADVRHLGGVDGGANGGV